MKLVIRMKKNNFAIVKRLFTSGLIRRPNFPCLYMVKTRKFGIVNLLKCKNKCKSSSTQGIMQSLLWQKPLFMTFGLLCVANRLPCIWQQYKIAVWPTDQPFCIFMVAYSPMMLSWSNFDFIWVFTGSQEATMFMKCLINSMLDWGSNFAWCWNHVVNSALYWYNIFQWGVQRWAHVVKVHNADFMLPIKHSMLKLRYNAWLGLEPLWCLYHVFVNEHYADITLQKRAPCIVCVVKKRTMLNKSC